MVVKRNKQPQLLQNQMLGEARLSMGKRGDFDNLWTKDGGLPADHMVESQQRRVRLLFVDIKETAKRCRGGKG